MNTCVRRTYTFAERVWGSDTGCCMWVRFDGGIRFAFVSGTGSERYDIPYRISATGKFKVTTVVL